MNEDISEAAPSVKVALVQSPSELGEVANNLERIEIACRSAASNGAKIIVLPETAITGYLSQDLRATWRLPQRPLDRLLFCEKDTVHPAHHAELRDGPSTMRLALLAAELGAYITVPFLERESSKRDNEDDIFYNAVSLVSPKSTRSVAHYRKNCPWPPPEKSWATPGEGVEGAMFDTEYGRVGLAICFDIHTILAKYADASLWALLYPVGWVGDTDEWFGTLLPQRLAAASVPHHILAANWATIAPQTWAGAGGSTVYGPHGVVLSTAVGRSSFRGKPDIVYATLPTQSYEPCNGSLDLTAYRSWSESQIGTRYWLGKAEDQDWTFQREMLLMSQQGERSAQDRTPGSDEAFLEARKAAKPWRPRRLHAEST